jgi:two-component system cell cycle response regulator
MSMPGAEAGVFCRILRQTPAGKESYALLLASPGSEGHILEAIDAGADDVLVKPVNIQTLRVRLNTATRMLLLREEIQRERRGIMRSTDEFAVAHKRLLQDALTDALTQLPNRRHGLDFLASEWAFAQSNGLPMACLLLDIDHFKRINDTYGHAAGRCRPAPARRPAQARLTRRRSGLSLWRRGVCRRSAQRQRARRGPDRRAHPHWSNVHLPLGPADDSGHPEHRRRQPEWHEKDSQALIQAADAALYEAKRSGRNRVVVAA